MLPVRSPRLASPAAPAPMMGGGGAPVRSLSEMQMAAKKYGQYSLSKLAERKIRQLGLDALDPAAVFKASDIVSGREAQTVYLCLPFVSTPPKMVLQ